VAALIFAIGGHVVLRGHQAHRATPTPHRPVLNYVVLGHMLRNQASWLAIRAPLPGQGSQPTSSGASEHQP
jgi:hypothetical protein